MAISPQGPQVTYLPSFLAAIFSATHQTTCSRPKASARISSLAMPLRTESRMVSGPTRWRQVAMAPSSPPNLTANSSRSTGSVRAAASTYWKSQIWPLHQIPSSR